MAKEICLGAQPTKRQARAQLKGEKYRNADHLELPRSSITCPLRPTVPSRARFIHSLKAPLHARTNKQARVLAPPARLATPRRAGRRQWRWGPSSLAGRRRIISSSSDQGGPRRMLAHKQDNMRAHTGRQSLPGPKTSVAGRARLARRRRHRLWQRPRGQLTAWERPPPPARAG